MMDWIIEIISWACVGVLWINAEPMIRLRNWIYGCSNRNVWHWRLITCCMCSSFWIAMIATGSILSAAVISVLAELVCRQINSGSI